MQDLWKELQSEFNQLETRYTELEKQRYGIYWTNLDLAYEIINDLFSHLDENFINNLTTKKFLEPCVGMGSFIFAYLRKLFEIGISSIEIREVINNIYFAEIDECLLQDFYNCYQKFVHKLWNISIGKEILLKNSCNGLIYNRNFSSYLDLTDAFNVNIKFDIIITNPPYKNLKIDSRDYVCEKKLDEDKTYYRELSKLLKPHFSLQGKGTLNLFKLFVEKILTDYSAEQAYISLLIPNTILADNSNLHLRELLFKEMDILQVDNYDEKNPLFDKVTQALCNLYLRKTIHCNPNQEIKFKELNNIKYMEQNKIQFIDDNLSIVWHSSDEINKLEQLKKFPKIKDIPSIINMRGELDMSLNKKYISDFPTDLKLLKGGDIGPYFLAKDANSFVNSGFSEITAKGKFILEDRIACPQISNQNTKVRLKFSLVSKGYVLANSCNFIYSYNNDLGYDLYYLLGLMNSDLLNWFFKKFNSNNHIANYEIDNLPVHTDFKTIKAISDEVKTYIKDRNINRLNQINYLCLKGFNLVEKNENIDYSNIFDEKKFYKQTQISGDSFSNLSSLASSYRKYFIDNNLIMNNTGYKLSDLDIEMIKNIPQGGNWKDIPEATVKKSKRLLQITESGGRTTLYGRIKYDEPSYTITTYFNRPGNGTYVHPNFDRVITAREAARFQSFPDTYYFYGNKTEVLKQIGNAVPCIFAESIGRRIKHFFPEIKTFGDLFAGAGGLSQGLSQAGLESIFANEMDLSACISYKANHTKTDVIHGDILTKSVQERIYQYKNCIDILSGGPPCQGFSNAGKRIIDDPRNKLFIEFIKAIEVLNPKIVIMENVQGFLTLDNGKFLSQTKEMLINLGYICQANLLNTVHYGVPQKRKRVIILAVKNSYLKDHSIDSLFPIPNTIDTQNYITAYHAISDLENIQPNTIAEYSTKTNPYLDKIKY